MSRSRSQSLGQDPLNNSNEEPEEESEASSDNAASSRLAISSEPDDSGYRCDSYPPRSHTRQQPEVTSSYHSPVRAPRSPTPPVHQTPVPPPTRRVRMTARMSVPSPTHIFSPPRSTYHRGETSRPQPEEIPPPVWGIPAPGQEPPPLVDPA